MVTIDLGLVADSDPVSVDQSIVRKDMSSVRINDNLINLFDRKQSVESSETKASRRDLKFSFNFTLLAFIGNKATTRF